MGNDFDFDYGNGSGSEEDNWGPNEEEVVEFFQKVDMILNRSCDTLDAADEVLEAIYRCAREYEDRIQMDRIWVMVACKIIRGRIYQRHPIHIRNKMIQGIKRETVAATLHVMATVLTVMGHEEEENQDHPTFHLMLENDCFQGLKDQILERKDDERQLLVRQLMKLLYEMSRIQKLRREDLHSIDDSFIKYLLGLIEKPAKDDDPYNYIIIRVLLMINEQYMIRTWITKENEEEQQEEPLVNRVLKALSLNGSSYISFGTNIIFLLNRETETALQLLILKVLYLLFTTPQTQEFFYETDLWVLLDVMMRNILDLPDESKALRHSYLRVLHPLLQYSQLKDKPYKIDQLTNMFDVLTVSRSAHFAPTDDDTVRLVKRCREVEWLQPPQTPETSISLTPSLSREPSINSTVGSSKEPEKGPETVETQAEDVTKPTEQSTKSESEAVTTEPESKPKPQTRRRHPPPPTPRKTKPKQSSLPPSPSSPRPPSPATPLSRTSSYSSTHSSPTQPPQPHPRNRTHHLGTHHLGMSHPIALGSQHSILEFAQTSVLPGINTPSRSGRKPVPPPTHPRVIKSRRPPPPPIPPIATTTNHIKQRPLPLPPASLPPASAHAPPPPPPPAPASRPQTPASPASEMMSSMAIDFPDHRSTISLPPPPIRAARPPPPSLPSVKSALGLVSTPKTPPSPGLNGKAKRPPIPPPRKPMKKTVGH